MKHQLVIGWLLASDVQHKELLEAYHAARQRLTSFLAEQFPEIDWQCPFIHRRIHSPHGAIDPLSLLDLGGEEKLHRGWDFALVIVPNELTSRQRIATIAIPSSPLEVAVMSSARIGDDPQMVDRLTALAVHLLGHLWGLNDADAGPMKCINDPLDLQLEPFLPDEIDFLRQRHAQLSDPRLEEDKTRHSAIDFFLRTLLRDWRAIVHDVIDARPWTMPLYLGRLTAAAAISTILMLFSADAWALGARLDANWTLASTLLAILVAAASVYTGQNIGHQGRLSHRSEQLVRTKIVLASILFVGMASLWLVLLVIAVMTGHMMPRELIAEWSGLPAEVIPSRINYAVFVANVGVLAASLGGNLEEQGELKAELLFDEET